jgi:F-type H+-transporting ATPase subunit gamma
LSFSAFYEKAEIKADPAKPTHLIVAISSDRGLCGGIHSGIVKAIKHDLIEKKNVENVKIVAVGDKARGILQRYSHIFQETLKRCSFSLDILF